MLLELSVENYAVVEKVRVRFHRGLNLLTGETGSGKSIVVDALALLLGGRAAAEMVRSGAQRARISGIFEVDGQTLPEGVEPEDGELIVEREILPNGKSRAFAGGRPVTAALLKELTSGSSAHGGGTAHDGDYIPNRGGKELALPDRQRVSRNASRSRDSIDC